MVGYGLHGQVTVKRSALTRSPERAVKGLTRTAGGIAEVTFVDHEYYRHGRLTVRTAEAPPAKIADDAADLQ